jgi:hypothetical protein
MKTTATRSDAAAITLLVGGAVSAGVHAGLAPEHLHEWLPLGLAFVAAAAAAALGVAALVLRPTSPWPPRVLGASLGGVIAAYAATRLAALPPLDPEREPLDLLGVCTSAVEAVGVAAAVRLGWARSGRRPNLAITPGGTA